MNAYAVSSIVLAFFATAGAIPMLRVLPLLLRREVDGAPPTLPDNACPRIAGAGVFFGIFLASFYLLEPMPDAAGGLVLGAVLMIVIGGLAEGIGSRPMGAVRALAGGAFGALVAGVFALEYLDFSLIRWTPGFFLVLVTALITPLAMARMANRGPASASAGAPMFIGLIEVLMLLLFGAVAAIDKANYALADEFLIVALPAVGSIAAALIYLSPMPWRRQALVATGIGGSLALGLLISWGVLRMGPATVRHYGGMSALLWLVAIPMFELVLDFWRFFHQRVGTGFDLPGRLFNRAINRPHSLFYLCASSLVFGLAGIVLWRVELYGYWSTFGLVPAFLAWVLLPEAIARLTLRRRPATAGASLDPSSGASNRQAS